MRHAEIALSVLQLLLCAVLKWPLSAHHSQPVQQRPPPPPPPVPSSSSSSSSTTTAAAAAAAARVLNETCTASCRQFHTLADTSLTSRISHQTPYERRNRFHRGCHCQAEAYSRFDMWTDVCRKGISSVKWVKVLGGAQFCTPWATKTCSSISDFDSDD